MEGDTLADTILKESVAETSQSVSIFDDAPSDKALPSDSTAEITQNNVASEEDQTVKNIKSKEQSTTSDMELTATITPEIELTTDPVPEAEQSDAIASKKKELASEIETLHEEQMEVTESLILPEKMVEEDVILTPVENTSEEVSEQEQTLTAAPEKDKQTSELEDLQEKQMDITESLTLPDEMVQEDVILTPVENANDDQGPGIQEKIENDVSGHVDNYVEQSQTEISDTIMDKLQQLPDSFNVSVSSDLSGSMSGMNTTNAPTQEPTDILQEAAKNIEPNKWKPKGGAFSLGVPGLSFSAQNLKISSDGTKMIQIHQSQITSNQLDALQANPNIKVVFRHIPSGKSFTKPPKNLFKKKSVPKPALAPIQNGGDIDDSVYNFDDFEGPAAAPAQESHPKKLLSNEYNPNRYARYNPNVGFKKKPGRPRQTALNSDGSKPVLPAQIQLTDALVKLNKPGALYTIKVHVKQVTHDILINMELNPKYNIVLTAKHEKPPEHSLEELVKEWEEKETVNTPQETPTKETAKEPATVPSTDTQSKTDEAMDTSEEPVVIDELPSITPESKKAKKEEAAKLKEQKMLQRQKEEEEAKKVLSAAVKETTSRSGRIRKPSRFSLDIAKMTKRRAPTDSDSTGSPASKKSKLSQTPPPPVIKTPDGVAKKGRGRPPKKTKKQEEEAEEPSSEDSSSKAKSQEEKEEDNALQKSPSMSNEPRVLLSPVDKQMADKKLFGKKKDAEKGISETNLMDTSQSSTSSEKSPNKGRKSKSPKKPSASPQKKDESALEVSSSSSAVDDCDLPDLNRKTSPKKQSPVKLSVKLASSSKDTDTPSDILARKLSKEADSSESDNVDAGAPPLKDFVEEGGDVDNKYRLRKLLQQCSIEEIRSVAMPKALDIISLGDFFTYKAGQMSKSPVSFTSLYEQLENFYMSMEKEASRYSTLLRRANKVGGDRRMEKVILMPVYNRSAAESLKLSSNSVDAHIGGIYQKPTTPMIAANSFHMNCKMDPPVHRLKLPDISDKSHGRGKQHTPATISNAQAQFNMLYSRQNYGKSSRGSWKKNSSTVHKSDLISGENAQGQTLTLQEHARIQAASRYQPSKQATTAADTAASATIVHTATKVETDQAKVTQATESVQLNTLTTEAGAQILGETVTAEEGATIVQAEDGKQLVSIGDGQYVELPEGYTLIQTDEGYIIGQPGATFVQGEDGNVYMTSTEEGGTEGTDQVLTKTVDATETAATSEEQVIEPVSQS